MTLNYDFTKPQLNYFNGFSKLTQMMFFKLYHDSWNFIKLHQFPPYLPFYIDIYLALQYSAPVCSTLCHVDDIYIHKQHYYCLATLTKKNNL